MHLDIKPDNFLFGYQKKSGTLHTIDFGLAKQYRDEKGHIPFTKKYNMVGTARYASENAHQGCELSRRDDLESIGIMMLSFVKGALPWEDVCPTDFT